MKFIYTLMLFVTFCLQADKKPNVIFFAVDDMNDWISPMGYSGAKTPNLDRLATMGITFQNAHCPGVYCAPSRTAIFTGRFATTTGCYRNQVYFFEKPDLTPLQVKFRQSGYKVFGGGKLFHHPSGFIDKRGWNEFFLRSDEQRKTGWPLNSWTEDTPLPKIPASPYNQKSGKKVTGGLFLEWAALPNDKENEMADTKRIDWACSVLEKEHNAPFFLAVGIYAPHFPNYVPKKYFDMYNLKDIKAPLYKDDDLDDLPTAIRKKKINRRKSHHDKLVKLGLIEEAIHGYLASISYADAMLGKILDSLEKSSHKDNTIIVFWSDHGYHHGEKGDWGKHTLWERTSNVPFLWAGPGLAKNTSIDASVSLIDMYPTFVELCGLKKEEGLDGKSLAKTLKNPKAATDRNVFLPYMEPNSYAVINQKWRYIHYADKTEELYDLTNDPHEWHNIANNPEMKDIKAKLKASAPKNHAKPGSDKSDKKIELVIKDETYFWKKK